MIWLTWRQFRLSATVACAALALLAVLLAATGADLAHLYVTSGLTTCHGQQACGRHAQTFLSALSHLDTLLYVAGFGALLLAPAIIGLFWGAPLVAREVETGTFRLAWNQSVTRRRWLTAKIGLIGLAAMATGGLFSLMVTWWSSPIDTATERSGGSLQRFSSLLFVTRGITPIGYAAFAFALGVGAGVLIRRTIPAMAATLGVYAGVQIAWPLLVRPHLLPPLTTTQAVTTANVQGLSSSGSSVTLHTATPAKLLGAWIYSMRTVTAAGRAFTGPMPLACPLLRGGVPAGPPRKQGAGGCLAAFARLHLRQLITYQPASRYWPLQWLEAGIFLALALALIGFCFWWVQRRRLS